MTFQTQLGSIKDPVERYFAIARERQSIFLKKEAGLPRPWTDDAIFNTFKFCNVFREQDKVTRWFKNNIRDKLRHKPEVLLATVVFRWFNRIETGDIVFNQTLPEWEGNTPWDFFLETGDGKSLEKAIRLFSPNGPHVTGSYTITSKPGMNKLAGMCSLIQDFYHGKFEGWASEPMNWRNVADEWMGLKEEVTLEMAWDWLKEVPYMGKFHSYEVITDLRHTDLLDTATDINEWAKAGPGCIRGLNRFFERDLNFRIPKDQVLQEMKQILSYSRDTKYWPNNKDYPAWEMREVEHWCCEHDKMCRVYDSNGARRPRGVYK
jgi:hypothetical protein